MPIYKYVCDHCDEAVEVLLLTAEDEEPTDCDNCGNPDCLRKVIGGTSFQLKGKGWYRDGY